MRNNLLLIFFTPVFLVSCFGTKKNTYVPPVKIIGTNEPAPVSNVTPASPNSPIVNPGSEDDIIPGKYAATNVLYKEQVNGYAKLLEAYPIKDSAGLPFADEWVGTTNLSVRRPNFVVIHHTAQNSCEQTLQTFTLPRTEASAHYVICRDGTVYHMLNDLLRAHHAGVSKWGNNTDINSSSIGIELDNNGFEPFSEAQINSLLTLLERLKNAYRIPTPNFVGHADVAPGRKVDPNKYFPWQKLAEEGYGLWYDTVGIAVPPDFNPLLALRIIGYDIKNEQNAIQSFKIHFVQNFNSLILTNEDKKILFDLMRKYQ